tara:strand:- start:71 stop:577 length:507 start_codon:yes stop_codon:yes gene_type:complete
MSKIIDNFLDKKDFNNLKKGMEDTNYFPWFYAPCKDKTKDKTSDTDLNQWQFTHIFYENYTINSSKFDLVRAFIKKINPTALLRIKANLTTYSPILKEGEFHQDTLTKNVKSAIYYLNTNDGYTLFKKDKKKIESVANRMVFFNSTEWHTGTNTTNAKKRIVINFIYI